MTEDRLEQEMLTWLAEIGYNHVYGPTIACDGEAPERSNYQDILLIERLRRAINQLNSEIPPEAREDALQQVRNLNTPILLSANRRLHNFLVNGVPVEYQKDGETRGDFVRLIDFETPSNNRLLSKLAN